MRLTQIHTKIFNAVKPLRYILWVIVIGWLGASISTWAQTSATVSITGTADGAEQNGVQTIPGQFTFIRSMLSSSNTIVIYSVLGTATNASDYVQISDSIVIPANQSNAILLITPIEDADFESNESVVIQLLSVINVEGTLIDNSSSNAFITIFDDDVGFISLQNTNGTNVTGVATAGFASNIEVVNLSTGSNLICTTNIDIATGNFNCPLSPIPTNTQILNVIITDANNSANSFSQTLVVDQEDPTNLSIAFANANQLTGSGEADVAVEVSNSADGGVLCTTTISSSNTFICNFNVTIADGTLLNVDFTDASGNQVILNSTVDAIAPDLAPELFASATQLMGQSEAGATIIARNTDGQIVCQAIVPANSIDFVCVFSNALTNAAALNIIAVDEAQNESSTDTVFVDSILPEAIFDSTDGLVATALASEVIDTLLVFADGVEICNEQAINSTNLTCTFTSSVTIDQSLTAIVIDNVGNRSETLTISFSTIASPTLNVVGNLQGFVTVSGTAPPNMQILVTFPDSSTNSVGIPSTGEYLFFSSTPQPNGIIAAQVIAISGNTSQEITVTYLETLAPSEPAVTVSASNNGNAVITGTTEIVRDDDTLTVDITYPDQTQQTLIVDRATAQFIAQSSQPLAFGGTGSITVTDFAGNSTTVMFSFTEVIPPSINNLEVVSDTQGNVSISGEVESGTSVTVTFTDGSIQIVGVPDGNFTINSASPQLSSGIILIQSIDSAGNIGEDISFAFTETVAPTQPTVQIGSDTAGVITFIGTAEQNSVLTISLPDGSTTTTSADTNRNYSATSPPNQPNGTIQIFATDIAGNQSLGLEVNYVETVPPDAPEIIISGNPLGIIQVTGTAEANGILSLILPDASSVTFSIDANGNFDFTSSLPQPSGVLVALVTDVNGNVGESRTLSFTETQIPPTPDIQIEYMSDGSFNLVGQSEGLTTANILLPNGTTRNELIAENGAVFVAFALNERPEEAGIVTITATDSVGNVSLPASFQGQFTPPSVTSFVVRNGILVGQTDPNVNVQLIGSGVVLCADFSDANGDFICPTLSREIIADETLTIVATDIFFNVTIVDFSMGDQDGDGISDEEEIAGPNQIEVDGLTGSDANNDGIIDAAQGNVVTMMDSSLTNNANPVSIASIGSECNSFVAVQSLQETENLLSNEALPEDSIFSYPLGLINFNVSCEATEQMANIELLFYGFNDLSQEGAVLEDIVIRKFINGGYVTLWPESEVPGVTISTPEVLTDLTDTDGNPVEVLMFALNIENNGSLDDNSSAQFITDPIGIAIPQLGSIAAAKTVSKETATVGNPLVYTVAIENISEITVRQVRIVDLLPIGFKLLEGSDVISIGSSPTVAANLQSSVNALTTAPFDLDPGERATLSYVAIVGSGITTGIKTNRATATVGGQAVSLVATANVMIEVDPILQRSNIIGKVFYDTNQNGVQDEGENGIGGARLATVGGEWITTDAFGRYNFPGIEISQNARGMNFILKLDKASLPQGAKLLNENPKIIRLTQGVLEQVNFAVAPAVLVGQEKHTLTSPVLPEPYLQLGQEQNQEIKAPIPEEREIFQQAPDYQIEDSNIGLPGTPYSEIYVDADRQTRVQLETVDATVYKTVTKKYPKTFTVRQKDNQVIQDIVEVISELQSQGKRVSLKITGHSDNTPLKREETIRKYKDNYGIARYRATRVSNTLSDRTNVALANIQIISRGQEEPIKSFRLTLTSLPAGDNDFAWIISYGIMNENRATQFIRRNDKTLKAVKSANQFHVFKGPFATKTDAISTLSRLKRQLAKGKLEEIEVVGANVFKLQERINLTLSRRVVVEIFYDEKFIDKTQKAPGNFTVLQEVSKEPEPLESTIDYDKLDNDSPTPETLADAEKPGEVELSADIIPAALADIENSDDINTSGFEIGGIIVPRSKVIYLTVKSDKVFDSRKEGRKINVTGKRLIDGIARRIEKSPDNEYVISLDGFGSAYTEEVKEFSNYLLEHAIIKKLDATNISFERETLQTSEDQAKISSGFRKAPIVEIEEFPIDERSPRLQDIIDNRQNERIAEPDSIIQKQSEESLLFLLSKEQETEIVIEPKITEEVDSLLNEGAKPVIGRRLYDSLDSLLLDEEESQESTSSSYPSLPQRPDNKDVMKAAVDSENRVNKLLNSSPQRQSELSELLQ